MAISVSVRSELVPLLASSRLTKDASFLISLPARFLQIDWHAIMNWCNKNAPLETTTKLRFFSLNFYRYQSLCSKKKIA